MLFSILFLDAFLSFSNVLFVFCFLFDSILYDYSCCASCLALFNIVLKTAMISCCIFMSCFDHDIQFHCFMYYIALALILYLVSYYYYFQLNSIVFCCRLSYSLKFLWKLLNILLFYILCYCALLYWLFCILFYFIPY